MNAVLLSAGFGTRFRPYTNTLAKPAIPFLNLPFLCYSLYYAEKFGCDNAIINTHHLPASLKSVIDRYQNHLKIKSHFIHEHPDILDSGGGIVNSARHLNTEDHFWVFNTDVAHVLSDFDHNKALEKHQRSGSLCTVFTVQLKKPNTTRSIWVDDTSRTIKHIGDKKNDSHVSKHYVGVMLFSKKILQLFPTSEPQNIFYDMLLPLIESEQEQVCFHELRENHWRETGNLQDYLKASFEFTDKLIEEPNSSFSKELTQILNFFNLTPTLYKGDNCRVLTLNENHLDEDYQLQGHVILDNKTQLNESHIISNSVIYNQTKIQQNIENTLSIL